MSFFESEVVRAEMAEITELQEELYNSVFKFYQMDHTGKMSHVNLLQKLLDKQKILYTRLSLSDDPEAKKMKENISKSATMMGLPENVDMNIIFSNMQKLIERMKDQIGEFNQNNP
jgi:hypothetical protein